MAPPRCSVCAHPLRSEIDARLKRGDGLKGVARDFGLTHQTARRHRDGGEAHGMDPVERKPPPAPKPKAKPRLKTKEGEWPCEPAPPEKKRRRKARRKRPSKDEPETGAPPPRKTDRYVPAYRIGCSEDDGGEELPRPADWEDLVRRHGTFAEVAALRTREQRLAYIATLAHHGRWADWRTNFRLCRLWSLKPYQVDDLAAEAASAMYSARGSRQLRTLVVLAEARKLLRRAKKRDDDKQALKVLEFIAKTDGLGSDEADATIAFLQGPVWRTIAPVVEQRDPALFAELYGALVADEGRRRAAARILDLGAREGTAAGRDEGSEEGTAGEEVPRIDATSPAGESAAEHVVYSGA